MDRPPRDDPPSEASARSSVDLSPPSADNEPVADDTSLSGPSWPRYLAIALLCLVGLALAVSFAVVMAAGDDLTFTAEPSDPETESSEAATAQQVIDLEQRAENNPAGVADAFDTATEEGVYDEPASAHPDELVRIADDDDRYEYAVYGGEYYEWESAVGENSDHVLIELEPTTAQEVIDSVAVPYEEASNEAQSAVDGEEATGFEISEKIVDDDGTYYAVSMANPGVVIVQLFVAPITAVLQSVGIAFLVVGGWLLRKAVGGVSRPLSVKSIAGLAGVAGAATVGIGVLSSSFSAFSLASLPAIAAAVVTLSLVGLFVRTRQYGPLAGVLFAVPIATITLAGVSHALFGGVGAGLFGGVLTLFALVGAGLFGWPLIAYGYWFSSTPDPT
ncbi:hypothetical protein [Halostagnicola bangensis]